MKNRTEVLDNIRGSKKINFEEASAAEYERKAYLSNLDLENGRMLFRVHCHLVPTIKKNFSSKYRRRGVPLTCPSCSKPSVSSSLPVNRSMTGSSSPLSTPASPPSHSQSHLLSACEAVRDIRDECLPGPVGDDKSLAQFFKRVVARHLEMDEDYYS